MKIQHLIRLRPFLALLPPVVAFVLQWTFWDSIQPRTWLLLYPAVFFSAWIGGLLPGLISTFASVLIAWWFFIPPQFSFVLDKPSSLFSIVVFSVMGVLFSIFLGRMKKAIRQADEAGAILHTSEERYRLLVDGVKDVANLMLDVNGRIVTWNQGAERLKGYTAGEIIGRHFSIFFPPDALTSGKPEAELAEARENGRAEDEGWRVRKDGSRFWGHVVITTLYNDEGEIQGYSKITRDITARKAAQDQLDLFFNLSQDMLCIASADGYFKRVNPAFTKTLGWSAEEMLARPFLGFVHPDDHAATLREVDKQVKAGQNILHFENRYLHKNGSWRVLSWSSVPDGDGLMFATARDITDQKVAEGRLRASEENLSVTLNSIGDAVMATDAEGRITRLNAIAEQLTGWSQAEAIGRPVSDIFHIINQQTRQPAPIPVASTLAQGVIHGLSNDTVLIARDGNEYPIADSCAPIRNREGGVIGAVLVFRDVTKEYAAQTALRDSAARIRAILDTVADGIITINQRGIVETMNPAAERLFGYAAAEVAGQNINMLMPEPYHSQHDGYIEHYCATGEARVIGIGREVVGQRKNGDAFPMYLAVSEMRLDSQRYFTGIVHDLTERKQAELSLVAAKEKAEMADRAKDSFLATMSHEIRTPLTGMLEMLSMTPLNRDQEETLQAAWDSGRGLLRIVSDILDWSKIEAGKLHLAPQPTSIPQLLQEVINTYSRVASAKSLVLRQHVDARLSPAHLVDGLRLSQVLNNFVSNALKFTHSGEVVLCAELLDRLESGERIRFSVRDTGIGITKDAQRHLFRRYQQESANTARMYGGTGLGLAICQSLVDLMDGQIELVSEPGHGSTFCITLTLPVSGAAAEALQTQNLTVEQRAVKPLFEGGADTPLVLAVDDHPINRDLLARQIKLLGLRAETAENGVEALLMWRDGRFALVITDCHMPEMDGYTLSRAIRKIEAEKGLPRTPIIAWTANALSGEEEQCRASGMDDLLVKPANLVLLKKTLAKWLSVAETGSSQPAPSLHDADSGQMARAIDHAVLEQVAPDSAAQIQVLQDFQSHIRADQVKLLEMLAQGDQAKVVSTAHRMTGSCRIVGAKHLAEICAAIEQAARVGDMAGARAAGATLGSAIKLVESYFVEVFKK